MTLPRRVKATGTKRIAVFRDGRFQRVAGTVLLWNDSDTIEEFDTKFERHSFRLTSLYINGVELDLTVNLTCAFDPSATLSRDPKKMADVFEQRRQPVHDQLEAEVRRVFERQLQHMVSQLDLSGNATIGQRVLPILEGSPTRSLLLKSLEIALDRSLPDLGYKLNRDFPITFTNLDLSPVMMDPGNPTRTVELIRRHLPGLNMAMLEDLIASLQAGDPIDWQDLLREGDAAIGWHSDADPSQPKKAEPTPAPSNPPTDHRLSKEDLSVLKQVPEVG